MRDENVRSLVRPERSSGRRVKPRPVEGFVLERMAVLLRQGQSWQEADRATAGLPFMFRVTIGEMRDAALNAELRAALLECSLSIRPDPGNAVRGRIRALRFAASEIRASIARTLDEMRELPAEDV